MAVLDLNKQRLEVSRCVPTVDVIFKGNSVIYCKQSRRQSNIGQSF
jgi:hypothetical protein